MKTHEQFIQFKRRKFLLLGLIILGVGFGSTIFLSSAYAYDSSCVIDEGPPPELAPAGTEFTEYVDGQYCNVFGEVSPSGQPYTQAQYVEGSTSCGFCIGCCETSVYGCSRTDTYYEAHKIYKCDESGNAIYTGTWSCKPQPSIVGWCPDVFRGCFDPDDPNTPNSTLYPEDMPAGDPNYTSPLNIYTQATSSLCPEDRFEQNPGNIGGPLCLRDFYECKVYDYGYVNGRYIGPVGSCISELICPAEEEEEDSDFSIEINEPIKPIQPGDSTSYTVYLEAVGDFSENVTLADPVPGCPDGAVCSYSGSNTVFVSGYREMKILTVANTAGVLPGNYTLTAQGTGGGKTHSDTTVLSVTNPFAGLCDEAAVGDRKFVGCYYDGRYLTELEGTLADGPQQSTTGYNDDVFRVINQTWGNSNPSGVDDPFSVRFKGRFNFSGGNYEFDFSGLDDAARVYVDGVLDPGSDRLWDKWAAGSEDLRESVAIPAGIHEIWVDFQDLGGWSRIRLSWSKIAEPPPIAPTVDLSVAPATINSGSSALLTWSATNVDSCAASGSWSGSRATSGTESTGALTSNSTYNLECTGPGGTVSDSETVTVNPLVGPAPDVNAKITAINGFGSFSLSDIKDGDILSVTVNFKNSGPGSTDEIISSIIPSSNLKNVQNFFCPFCAGTYSSFTRTTPLNSGDDFDVTFDVTVDTETEQSKELITIDATGIFNPGNSPFTSRIILLASPDGALIPDFIEVPPGS